MKMYKIFVPFILLLIILTACGSKPAASAADGTYAYLQALAAKDKEKVVSLSCKSWEEQANLEVDALMSVDAALNNVTCKETGQDGEAILVVCNGTLDLTYNNEIRAIELDKRTYTMQMEDGQWRVCSYK